MYGPVDVAATLQCSAATETPKLNCLPYLMMILLILVSQRTNALPPSPLFTHSIMGWRLEAASSSDAMGDSAAAAARPFRNISNFSGMLRLIAYVVLLTTVVKRNNKGVD